MEIHALMEKDLGIQDRGAREVLKFRTQISQLLKLSCKGALEITSKKLDSRTISF